MQKSKQQKQTSTNGGSFDSLYYYIRRQLQLIQLAHSRMICACVTIWIKDWLITRCRVLRNLVHVHAWRAIYLHMYSHAALFSIEIQKISRHSLWHVNNFSNSHNVRKRKIHIRAYVMIKVCVFEASVKKNEASVEKIKTTTHKC